MFRGRELSVFVVLVVLGCNVAVAQNNGTWQLLLNNAGIASMHTAVTHFNTAIFLDRTNTGPTLINLPNGRCRDQPLERVLKHDCFAHSVMFDPKTNTVRPLSIFTDTWCSSGQFFSDGTLWQTGGDFEGTTKIRTLTPCPASGTCDWVELNSTQLAVGRWYSSNHILPSGNQMIIVGGRATPNYEFVPKRTPTEGTFNLAFLFPGGDNLYPYLALTPDGNLFIFAVQSSILFNYTTGTVLRNYPTLPGDTRNYPAAGSLVLLPLSYTNGFQVAEVLICGGATGGYNNGANLPAQKSCGRMVVTDPAAAWAMEDMPVGRTMGDMIILPTSDVLIINGAQNGSQGWGAASNPAFQPCLYATNNSSNRFTLLAPTTIARLYHSTANLLTDGRILLAGSNTHQFYTYNNTAFPTEFRVEAFSPPYLSLNYSNQKPVITAWPNRMRYGRDYFVTFQIEVQFGVGYDMVVQCNVNSAPFVTHSYSQGQRQLQLQTIPFGRRGWGGWGGGRGFGGWGGGQRSVVRTVLVTAPPNNVIAPTQWYMLWVVVNGIPGQAKWIQITP